MAIALQGQNYQRWQALCLEVRVVWHVHHFLFKLSVRSREDGELVGIDEQRRLSHNPHLNA